MIPTIDIEPLFGPASPAREQSDAAIMQAATGTGFMAITGPLDLIAATPAARAGLLRLFALPSGGNRASVAAEVRARQPERLSRLVSAAAWLCHLQGGHRHRSGRRALPRRRVRAGASLGAAGVSDPLQEPTPLPGWREAAARYYRAMERLGGAIMHAVARGLGLPEMQFEAAFQGGISTLRLIHYPIRPAALEALAQLDAGVAVDLPISDFAMPGMNGLMLIEEARRRRPDLPALLLTGYADASVRLAVEDAESGNTALLRKPVSGSALAERAAALLAHAVAPCG